ncbi:DNA-processing protein DprA [Urechidicola sp. KH5]
MNERELLAALALQKAKGIGDILSKKLIVQCGGAEAVFKTKPSVLSKISQVGTQTLRFLQDTSLFHIAEKELKKAQSENLSLLYFLNENYPEKLKHCIDGPLILFQDGAVNLNNNRIISIVGTRQMTLYGRDIIQKLVSELKEYNPIIISGFAYGVDITAQKAALENKLQTIGVLAHGFGQIYPKAHKKYVHQINEQGGFLSEFWFDDPPNREHFLQRNRVVAGISDATIIIESGEKGGSLVTADIANSYNRDVFAVPGKITDGLSAGCNALISSNKAALLTSANDIVRALNWDIPNKESNLKQPTLFLDLTSEEQAVFDHLLINGKQHIDTLSLKLQMPIFKLSSTLFNLEMKGVVRALQGKLFEASN